MMRIVRITPPFLLLKGFMMVISPCKLANWVDTYVSRYEKASIKESRKKVLIRRLFQVYQK